MFQCANPTKVIPDRVQLITGASVSFPDYLITTHRSKAHTTLLPHFFACVCL